MGKKLNWLDKFAEEQAQKLLNKKAISTKKAQHVVVNPDDVPNAEDGAVVEFNGEQFKVVDANYSDELGPGVVLERVEKVAGLEQVIEPPLGVSPNAQEFARTKLPIRETFNADDDAAWASTSAQGTAYEIATEDSTDRTTVPGHRTRSVGVTQTPEAAPNTNMYSFGEPAASGVQTQRLQANPGRVPNTDLTSFGQPMGGPQTTVGYPRNSVSQGITDVNPSQPTNMKIAPPDLPINTEKVDDRTEGLGNMRPSDYRDENRIEAKLKGFLAKRTKTTKATKVKGKTALNAKLIALANEVVEAIVDETEDILEDAENTVKKYVPARVMNNVLRKIESQLDDEGIEVDFNKETDKKQTKDAGLFSEVEDEELKQMVEEIVKAIVDEMEDVLKDADDEMTKESASMCEDENDKSEVEEKLKGVVERKLSAKGIHARFARVAKKTVAKKTVAERIHAARRARKTSK